MCLWVLFFVAGTLAIGPRFGTIGKEPEPEEPEVQEQVPEEPDALPELPEDAEDAMEGTGDGPGPIEEAGSGVFGSVEEPSGAWEPQWPEESPMENGEDDNSF